MYAGLGFLDTEWPARSWFPAGPPHTAWYLVGFSFGNAWIPHLCPCTVTSYGFLNLSEFAHLKTKHNQCTSARTSVGLCGKSNCELQSTWSVEGAPTYLMVLLLSLGGTARE